MNINIEVFVTGMLGVNCSIISNPDSGEVFLVDPGGDEDRIYKYINERHLNLKAILHTHAHFDHIMGTGFLIKKYYKNRKDIEIYLHKEDEFLWKNMATQTEKFGLSLSSLDIEITQNIFHNQIIELCGIQIRSLHTPGHSPGSCTFLIEPPFVSIPVLIVGDVIFQGSIGRTDLWGGDFNTLLKSIQDQILTYPDQTRIIAGHGSDTTVGEERQNNPFLANYIFNG